MANICRSPLVELVLRDNLQKAREIAVASAGVQASGAHICGRVLERREDAEWRGPAESHRSSTVSVKHLVNADLILTSCTTSRGAFARLAPESRHRTFTLPEAAWLGRDYQPPAEDGGDAVVAYAEYLDARRAVDGLPAAAGSRWGRSRGDSLSIPDGHNLGSGPHRRTLDSAEELARGIALQIVRARNLPRSRPI